MSKNRPSCLIRDRFRHSVRILAAQIFPRHPMRRGVSQPAVPRQRPSASNRRSNDGSSHPTLPFHSRQAAIISRDESAITTAKPIRSHPVSTDNKRPRANRLMPMACNKRKEGLDKTRRTGSLCISDNPCAKPRVANNTARPRIQKASAATAYQSINWI